MTHSRLVRVLALIAALALLSLEVSGMLAEAVPAGPSELVVVRLYVRDRDHLNAVAGELDIWEVHYDTGYAVAAVTPAQYEWLESQGYRLEIESEKTAIQAVQAPLDPRFYYFDDHYPNANGLYVVDFLQSTNAAYPNLTELIDIGDAWETGHGGHQRDLWVLRITNEDSAFGDIGAKPTFFLMANIHAREVATPELAIRYIKYLTAGYNGEGGYLVDPDVTWLVDYHVAYVLVMLNPDGHRVNEANTSALRRKNVDNDDGCDDPNQWGVDLNRNHSFFWNQGGTSDDPCNNMYHGPGAASEPETGAFQAFFATVMLDQNGDNGDNELPLAAPEDATGIFISLHSYGDLVMWPWGHSYDAAPNASQLETIGRKFAFLNGYIPHQDSDLYEASGISDDWTYGKFGVASFTFEVGGASGGACAGFLPYYECIDSLGSGGWGSGNLWPENKPAFLYAHKIARTPYLTAYGPDVVNVPTVEARTVQGGTLPLMVTIDDTRLSGSDFAQAIAAAEYYVDVPPWDTAGGPVSHPMAAMDGAFDEEVEDVVAIVDTDGLSVGRHTVYVRGRDADGNWGAIAAIFVSVMSDVEAEAIDLEVAPASMPIVYGRATVEATLTLSDGTPVSGWVVSFTAELGSISPPFALSDVDGHAVTALIAGEVPGADWVTARSPGPLVEAAQFQVYVPDAPTAGFAHSTPVCAGRTVVFTNTSGSSPLVPTQYYWDFGDGVSSALVSPGHVYGTTGTYVVGLTASNIGGYSTYTSPVTVQPVAKAGFALSPLYPGPGEQVQFVDRSTGEPTAWQWDLGDGGVASIPSPTHIFATTGTYNVSLRVGNGCGWSDPYIQPVAVGMATPRLRTYLPLVAAPGP
jgi:hypothetical protein